MLKRCQIERTTSVSPLGMQRACGARALFLAILIPMSLALTATAASSQEPAPDSAASPARSETQTQVEGPWRGLDVPRYPNGSRFHIETDSDEYELYFHSSDDVRAVFDYYRTYLEKQGFRVVRSKTTKNGMKANLARGQGPNHTIELDAKLDHGRYKVEIEFDE